MESFVAQTRRRLLKIAVGIGAPQDAEDSVQAAYHALLARSSLPDAPLLPWLMTTVIRIAYRRKAVEKRQTRLAERLARPQVDSSAHDHLARSEVASLVRTEVERLPANYRHVLVLYYLQGLSSLEIAGLLDVTPSAVTTRLQRGRQLLRKRLDPRMTFGLLFVPWLLWDGAKVFGGASHALMGGVVNAKAGMIMAAVGVSAGAMGAVFGATVLGDREPSANGRAQRTRTSPDVALIARLEDSQAEVMELRQQVETYQSKVAPKGTNAADAGNGQAAGFKSRVIAPSMKEEPFNLERARKAAEKLGVTEHELQVALRSYRAVKNKADPEKRRATKEELEGLGPARTPAVAAVLRGIEQGEIGGGSVRRLLAMGIAEGQEQTLIDVLKDDDSTAYVKTQVLRHLDAIPTETVRAYLLQRLEAEDDNYFASSLVMALGRMEEPRAVPLIRKWLDRKGWEAHQIYGIFALGKIGGREAEAVLIEFLRIPYRRYTASAVGALAKIDPALARSEAQALLSGPHAKRITDADKLALSAY
jgi:RNA polymerase sigma factor (sigma-70 family)